MKLINGVMSHVCTVSQQNPFTFVEVIASQRWDVFLRHSVYQELMFLIYT